MSPITIVMLCFSVLGALDLLIGNKFGLGKQFESGIMLLEPDSTLFICRFVGGGTFLGARRLFERV